MDKFKAEMIASGSRFFVELPFNVWEKWNQKGQILTKGVLSANKKDEEFQCRIIPKGKGVYYLPITAALLKKLDFPGEVEVVIEQVNITTNSNYLFSAAMSETKLNTDVFFEQYYAMILKRKSFHTFSGETGLLPEELKEIEEHIQKITPLMEGIHTLVRIVPKEQTSCTRGEYCVLFYSEKKEHYLENIGYMGEQLDLFLTSKNIGSCWFGMGSIRERKQEDLDFVIMMAIGRADADSFRQKDKVLKRKKPTEIWDNSSFTAVAEMVRIAPSACNTQPWYIEEESSTLRLYRIRGARGIMPENKVTFYNRIDLGIFMLFLELCLKRENVSYSCQLCQEEDSDQELIAVYDLKK